MTEQEEKWFDALVKDRAQTADILEKPSIRGFQHSIVDKYSEQAHFIYELLQNADDVEATTAKFRIEKYGLYFTHNGSIRFTVSDPQKEEEDTKNGTLGHINAITSIANSNKTQASIGKFGVGFKAVFQYTQTPHIYDPNIQFKIERFIVPCRLDTDLKWRAPSETVFFFPFDHKEKDPQKSYNEILEKLKSLEFPVLFLSNLKSVSFEAEEVTGQYTKEIIREIQQGDITVQWMTLSLVVNDERTTQYLLMFTRSSNSGHPYSIGYALGENGRLIPINRTAFCFFPTKEVTNLNFILHAPFLLTDSREGIKAGEQYNQELIQQLAQLAADSLPILRDEKLIDDSILEIIPYDESSFDNQDNKSRISFKPFYTTIKSKFKQEKLLPSKDNQFAKSENAYWASVPRIAQLISNEQLAFLTGNNNARWVFTSFGRDECLRKNKEIANYIDEIINMFLDEKDIINGNKNFNVGDYEEIFADFIIKQPYEWLFNFYEWLSETQRRMEMIQKRKIFIDKYGKAVASHDKSGKLSLFLPDNDGDDYTTLSPELFSEIEEIIHNNKTVNSKNAKEFFGRFGIREHTVKDEIESAIEKMKKGEISEDRFFAKVFKYFKDECTQNEIDNFISKIKTLKFLPYETKSGEIGYSSGQELYFPTEQLVSFYERKPETKFVDWEKLSAKYQSNDYSTLKKFLDKLGVNSQEPSKRDEVYNIILPQWRENQRPDNDTVDERIAHFKVFFDYFMSISQNESDSFLKELREFPFLVCFKQQGSYCWGKPAEIYLPTDDLKAWFETKPDTKFLLLDKYYDILDQEENQNFKNFLDKLGVASYPRVLEVSLYRRWKGRNKLLSDKKIDGLEELLEKIDHKKSRLLWKILTNSWVYYQEYIKIQQPIGGYKISSFAQELSKKKWILNRSGDLVSADTVTIQELSDEYDITSNGAKLLISFLKIQDKAQKTAHLSEEEARKIRLAEKIEKLGYSEEQALKILADFRQKSVQSPMTKDSDSSDQPRGTHLIQQIEERRTYIKHAKSSGYQESDATQPAQLTDSDEDTDDYIPKAINYDRKLERVKDCYAYELNRIEREKTLYEQAKALPRYSYGWFRALLELECMANSEKNANSKTISIRFGKVELESQSSRTIVLKEPNRFIPPSIEEFSDVRVDLYLANGRTEKVHVESFTVKEFVLVGKLASEDKLNGIDLCKVSEACIEIQNPSFLLQELLKRFDELSLDQKFNQEFNMKANLTPNIEFVFGPPGTGKTTHLAEKILIPMMQGSEPAKVLVLTPTNKAADVLTARIIEKMGTNTSYQNWLVRFGSSADESIEKVGVCRDRSFDINQLSHSVTVTTIARFAYDGFSGFGSQKLHKIKWDAIVIDEASMISLASIIYPLYCQQRSCKFIIAGDPFQIEPIVEVEEWKGENIYTLVGLSKAGAFANPVTEPHDYLVTNLETQYRSIPTIGEIFSRFTYNGILKHYRTAEMQRPLKLSALNIQPINLIKFPVRKYESIYRPKRLESGTPYHIYSALFTFEFVRWLAGQIQPNSHENKFHIGVIAPYRAQASILNKLNDSWSPKPSAVEIQVGTIHGFQGDECDIIVAVFNPPPTISSSPEIFLNKQNILNVAISRAQDYLFIVMPDDDTEGVTNLQKIAEIERLVKNSGSGFVEYASSTIEKIIWGNASYIEENTFSTGHQMVNVYRKPERYYEVRSDDLAIDIQIHEKPSA